MVHAMEGTLHTLNYQPSDESSPPPLMSDTSSVSSLDDMNQQEPIVSKKKRSIRNGFLFKNKKKTPEQNDYQPKHNNSLSELAWIQKKPSRTAALSSSH
jgi:hypothetical protein